MVHTAISVAGNTIGPGEPTFITVEIGQAHDGSLGTAHAYIDAVAGTGVTAVKFQTHIAEAESSSHEQFRVNFSYQDKTRYDYWRRMAFTEEQWKGLAEHARDKGLIFLSSAFSEPAVQLLNGIGMPAWKVASGEISNKPMLRLMAETGKPLLISTGMASWEQIDETLSWLVEWDTPFALYQCTTDYPCLPEYWGMNVMYELRERYGCPVGFSDHSGGIAAGLAAATLGSDMVEVHVVFSKDCFGPDVSSSITIDEMKRLVHGIRDIETALLHPVDKASQAQRLADSLRFFSKSIFAADDMPAGTRLNSQNICFKKPGTGIPAKDYENIIGKVIKKSMIKDQIIGEKDLEQ